MITSKINRKLVISSFAVLILVAVVGMGVYFWQHDKVNNLNQQLKAQKSMYLKLQSSNSNLQQENKNLSGKLNNANQSLSNATKIYHVGDTQDGITLVGDYHSSYQDLMAGNSATPPTINTIVFALSGVSTSDAFNSIVLTTEGNYLLPDSKQAPIAACGTNACVGFDVSDSNSNSPKYSAATFFYKNFQWQL